MKRGALLFAFNSPKYNYFEMAEFTAKRIEHFLKLPVAIVTDEQSLPEIPKFNFDDIIIVEPDTSNIRDHTIWINKGRYQAYNLSPYDETILLDTDYMVNSDRLNKLFELPTDFCCHDTTSFLMNPAVAQEVLSVYSFKTLWATVIKFQKTERAKQIFECLEMVQKNYEHYGNIHSFIGGVYRNDYALTLALRIANGHTSIKSDIIPWNLIHVGKNTSVHKDHNDEFGTQYVVMYDNWKRGKIRKEYCTIKNTDFHVMNKENFLELMSE